MRPNLRLCPPMDLTECIECGREYDVNLTSFDREFCSIECIDLNYDLNTAPDPVKTEVPKPSRKRVKK